MAQQHGADAVFASGQDALAGVLMATDGAGADVVYDCAGVQKTIELAIDAVRPRGTVMDIALWGGPATIDMNRVLAKEITITGQWLFFAACV